MSRLFVFETTHHALWAEQVAQGQGLGVQVVPAPEGADAQCGLAIETPPAEQSALASALEEAGVPYRYFPEGSD